MNVKKGSIEVIVIVVLAVGLVAALGYIFWQNSSKKDDAKLETTVTKTDSTKTAEQPVPNATQKVYAPTIPDGWKTHASDDGSLGFAIPSGENVEFQLYNINEEIHVGYGAPVWVKYSQANGWQTYENGAGNEHVLRQGPGMVKGIDVKAADQYLAAYYSTGDGPTGESRVLVVVDQKVYQFTFPGKMQTPEFLVQFVKTLTFK